jgi:signal transduction histidine kinase
VQGVGRASSSQLSTEQERLASVGQLVASIGHELRNPLSAIETSAYLLTQRLGEQITEEPTLGRHLEKIRGQVRLATRTVTQLLELAKNRPPSRVEVGLLPLLETAMEYLQCPSGVRIEVKVGAELSVFADPDQLRIVLVNLLTNALEVVGEHGSITVMAERNASGVNIVVNDDGPGVAAGERHAIFTPLHTTKPKGHGLGLPLCRRIAGAHGGHLSLLPSVDGASFQLYLPDAVTG